MGKGNNPTPDELKFAYDLMSRGYTDTDIQAEYKNLKNHGKLGTLPYREDIRFIRQRRKEYEAAKTVLKASLEQQADPQITKAREQHHAEMRELIEKLCDYLKRDFTPAVEERRELTTRVGVNNLPMEINKLRNSPVFECLEEHLPQPLMDFHDSWANKYSSYVEACGEFRREIRRQVEEWPGVIGLGNKLEEPILAKMALKQFHVEEGEQYEVNYRCRHGQLIACLVKDEEEIGDSIYILRANQPEQYEDLYRALSAKVLGGEEAVRLVRFMDELEDIRKRIVKSLNQALVSRSYIITTCKLCPGQPSSSS
jgi:hypothetical protein